MARLQKDVVNYFPHDANACVGDTLTVLQSRFGNDGYAFWFKLLEKLASTEGHYLDCRNSTKWQLLLAKMGVDEITSVEIMNLLVEMQAIDKELWESKLIWCQKLVDNVADVYKNRRREIPQKPITTKGNLIPTNSKPITTDDNTQSKVEYIKRNKKESIKKENNRISQLPDNIKELVTEFLKLPSWGNNQLASDVEWLSEFMTDFPGFSILHLKACRDHHIAKSTKHKKGAWKSRLRNWMTNEAKWRATEHMPVSEYNQEEAIREWEERQKKFIAENSAAD